MHSLLLTYQLDKIVIKKNMIIPKIVGHLMVKTLPSVSQMTNNLPPIGTVWQCAEPSPKKSWPKRGRSRRRAWPSPCKCNLTWWVFCSRYKVTIFANFSVNCVMTLVSYIRLVQIARNEGPLPADNMFTSHYGICAKAMWVITRSLRSQRISRWTCTAVVCCWTSLLPP